MRIFCLTLAAATLAMPVALLAADTQTMQGTVTDAACGAHHGMKDMTAAQCTRICAKESGYALVSGDKVYALKGDKTTIDKFAGQAVTVKGTVTGTTIAVADIAAK